MNHPEIKVKLAVLLPILLVTLLFAGPMAAADYPANNTINATANTTINTAVNTTAGDLAGNTIPYRRGSNDVVNMGNLQVLDTVNGSAVAIFGSCTVDKGANGDVVAILGNAKAKGNVNGAVVAVLGNADVEGQVNGDVVAVGGTVTLKDNTVVNGNVVGAKVIQGNGVVIQGNISNSMPRLNIPMMGGGSFRIQPFLAGLNVFGMLLSFMLASLMLALYPSGVEKISLSAEKDTWRDLAVGFIAWLALIMIFFTILGIPLTLFFYLSAKILGFAGVALFIGRKFISSISRRDSSMYLQVLAGILLVGLIKFVPVISTLVSLVVFWLSLGALLDTKFGTGRTWFRRT